MFERNMADSKAVYDLLCKMFDNREWQYEKIEKELMIKSSLDGDNFPIEFDMRVIPECEIVSFLSWLPIKISKEKRMDMALTVCAVNNRLVAGSFDYNMLSGEIAFRFTTCYQGSILSEELLEDMIMISWALIDEYSDKFFTIANNTMTLQEFIESRRES